MALTLEQIVSPVSLAEARQFMIDTLTSIGFTGAASWQSGSFARTLGVEVPAYLMSNLSQVIVQYGKGGYNDTAYGDWLTIFSKSHYDNDRFGSVATQGTVLLASAEIVHDLDPGELVVADAESGRTFRNLEAINIPAHSVDLEVLVEAEVPGVLGNVPAGSITTVVTSLAGVTVSNPGEAGQWITREGADPEEDPALQQRNRTKWASRAYATPAAGYENYAREADPSITRVFVDDQNPMGPGSVRAYIAGELGPSTEDAAQNVEDYIEGVTEGHEDDPTFDGYVRRPLCSEFDCEPAVQADVPVVCDVIGAAGYGDLQELVTEAILEYFSSVPIGGTKDDRETGHVLISGLYRAVMAVPGVVNVTFSAPPIPPGDVELEPNEVAVPDITVNVTYL